MEVVNTLLVLLSPVAYPRDHSKQAGDLRAHNPFLYMLMSAALPDGKKSYWAPGLVRRLLQNSIEQLQATGPNATSNTAVVALRKAREMSLIAMSGISDQAYEQEQFSYFTLEGVGSIAGEYCSLVIIYHMHLPLTFVVPFINLQHQSSDSRGASSGILLLARILLIRSPIEAFCYSLSCYRVVETVIQRWPATHSEERCVALQMELTQTIRARKLRTLEFI